MWHFRINILSYLYMKSHYEYLFVWFLIPGKAVLMLNRARSCSYVAKIDHQVTSFLFSPYHHYQFVWCHLKWSLRSHHISANRVHDMAYYCHTWLSSLNTDLRYIKKLTVFWVICNALWVHGTGGNPDIWPLTLYVLNFQREHKHIFTYCVITPHWYDTGT